MSNMINVDGSDDPSYRYKMPRLVSKVEGRGNGVKTVLVNCPEVARSLHRSSAQVTKFFGCDLGAMTKYDEKIDRCLVNGAFENKVLQEALTGYIQKFVLCPSCGNPETVQELKGKKKAAIVILNCKACGASEEADNTHKLITFIVKEISPVDAGNKKEMRKKKRQEKDRRTDGENSGSNDEEKKKKKKKKKNKDKDGKKKKKKDRETQSTASTAAEKKQPEDLSSSDSEPDQDLLNDELGAMTVHDVAALNSSVERITGLVKQGVDGNKLLFEIEEQQVNSGLGRADRIPIFMFSLVNAEVPLQTVMEKIKLGSAVVTGVKDCFKTSKDIEVEFLLSLEEAVARQQDDEDTEKVRKYVPVVLKLLYDEDLVEEKTVMEWYSGSLEASKYKHVRCIVEDSELQLIKNEAAPIIEWFKDAESDSDDSDE